LQHSKLLPGGSEFLEFQDISSLGGGRKKYYYVKKPELSLQSMIQYVIINGSSKLKYDLKYFHSIYFIFVWLKDITVLNLHHSVGV